ncbi:MAG: zinc finger domain-containing protein [Candidatus Marsarchaeota archaeon]|nr:zinc finger domain-containing protein [Candidatus Marsarchaeota archaeon]MCL5413437.1 zinc finger domain-containing protein [Candidatus Marsarchaeota archaeon]
MSELRGKICSSCGRLSGQYVEFKCPKCLEEIIIRCYGCREKHTTYRCLKCGTEGP